MRLIGFALMPWVSKHALYSLLDFHEFKKSVMTQLYNMQLEIRDMGAREDAANARFGELIASIRDGMLAKDAEIYTLRAALHNADQTAVQRVQEALDADSEHDAARIEQANAALEELTTRANGGGDEVPEHTPVETGSDPTTPSEGESQGEEVVFESEGEEVSPSTTPEGDDRNPA